MVFPSVNRWWVWGSRNGDACPHPHKQTNKITETENKDETEMSKVAFGLVFPRDLVSVWTVQVYSSKNSTHDACRRFCRHATSEEKRNDLELD